MNIFTFFRNEIVIIAKELSILNATSLANLEASRVIVEPSRQTTHGDIATNAALALAHATGLPPMTLATSLAQALQDLPFVAACAVKAPGFVNITLDDAYWRGALKNNLLRQEAYGYRDIGKGETVTVESPLIPATGSVRQNTRWAAAQADVLATVLQMMGYRVDRVQDSSNAFTRIHKGGKTTILSAHSQNNSPFSAERMRDASAHATLNFLLTSAESAQSLDLASLLKKGQEACHQNPLFLIHYASVRIASVRRHIETLFPTLDLSPQALLESNFEILHANAERYLMKLLAQWPYHAERVCVTLETQRIAHYLCTVAGAFHAFWKQHAEMAELHFVYPSDRQRTRAYFALLQGIKNVIAAGFRIYKIAPLKEMNGCI